jgi:hypothetical protein
MEGHSRTSAPARERRSSDPGPDRSLRRRRPVLRCDELDSDPRRLRGNLEELAAVLRNSNPRVRRRILLMFGELVARWQGCFSGQPISVVVDFLPDAVRMTFRNPQTPLTRAAWDEVVSPMVLDLVDSWGIDRRRAGSAWFEFRDDRSHA